MPVRLNVPTVGVIKEAALRLGAIPAKTSAPVLGVTNVFLYRLGAMPVNVKVPRVGVTKVCLNKLGATPENVTAPVLGVTKVFLDKVGAIPAKTKAPTDGTNVVDAITALSSLSVAGAATFASDSSFTSTGAVLLPKGTTAQQPTGVNGKIRYNTTTNTFEGYANSAWGSIGGGATGAGGDQVFVQNQAIVTTSYTLSTGYNAESVGPITINSGAIVTVPSVQRWVVL